MTPKQTANELIEKFLPEVRGADRYSYNLEDMNVYIAKQCAKIAVEEVQRQADNWGVLSVKLYWESVMKELN